MLCVRVCMCVCVCVCVCVDAFKRLPPFGVSLHLNFGFFWRHFPRSKRTKIPIPPPEYGVCACCVSIGWSPITPCSLSHTSGVHPVGVWCASRS
uniref:Putative secreted peptide n=1 Tax=Anopheles braziliensis TaxID=58242 RepID=A0A2M3ZP38_9DIPT